MNIHVNIDSLILDGIEISQRERPLLKTAVESELSRLLTENGLDWQTGVALHAAEADPIQLKPENNPTQMGQQIAHSVYGGINR